MYTNLALLNQNHFQAILIWPDSSYKDMSEVSKPTLISISGGIAFCDDEEQAG
jgi:hypothetical protein